MPKKIKQFKQINMLKDSLYYVVADSGASVDQAKGVVIGVVSVLMAEGMDFEQAIMNLAAYIPSNYRLNAIPEVWRADFKNAMVFLRRETVGGAEW